MDTLNDLKYTLTEKDRNELKYTSIVTIILAGVIYLNAFENNTYTCKNILVNTYLYILISLLLFHIITMLLINNDLHIRFFTIIHKFNYFMRVVIFIAIIAILFGLFYAFDMNSTNILVSHFILLILISFFSLFISLQYAKLKKRNLYNKVFYTTLLFICVLLLLFYFNQDLIKQYLSKEYYYIVLILFFVVLLVELVYILLIGYNKTITVLISAIVLIIFGYFLLADTQRILDISEENCNLSLKNCNANINCDIDNYPNYPQKSFNIFNNIIVIFQQIAEIFLANSD
tara:strand:- start:133 stop:996 length:864 start_codon:yes stop_codon:yes gene_type:complete